MGMTPLCGHMPHLKEFKKVYILHAEQETRGREALVGGAVFSFNLFHTRDGKTMVFIIPETYGPISLEDNS